MVPGEEFIFIVHVKKRYVLCFINELTKQNETHFHGISFFHINMHFRFVKRLSFEAPSNIY